jgi:hypothetical protein
MADQGLSLEEAYATKSPAPSPPTSPASAPSLEDDAGLSLESVYQAQKPTIVQRLAGAPERILRAYGEFVDQFLTPSNWVDTARETANVIGQIPGALKPTPGDPMAGTLIGGIPQEARQGAFNTAVTLPQMLAVDLPNAVAGGINDLLLGSGSAAEARTAEQQARAEVSKALGFEVPNIAPPSAEQTRALVESYAPDVFGKAEEELTPEEKLARRVGEFGAAGAIGGPTAVIPSMAAAIPTRVAEEVAPDSPAWQLVAGGAGAMVPELAARAVPATQRAVARIPSVTKSGAERQAAERLLERTGGQPVAATAPDVPGLRPTTAELEPRLRSTQAEAAKTDPLLRESLAAREAENIAAARTAMDELGGKGLPESGRTLAERTVAEADAAAEQGLLQLKGVHTQDEATRKAADLIDASVTRVKNDEKILWNQFREFGQAADVPTQPLKRQLINWVRKQPKAYHPAKIKDPLDYLPPEIAQTLRKFGEKESIVEIQELRPVLRELRDNARYGSSPDARSARIYGGLYDVVTDYLKKGVRFEDPRIRTAHEAAIAKTLERVDIFDIPKEMRRVTGTDSRGGDLVSPGATLKTFVKKGPEGRDSIAQLLRADPSPDMRQFVMEYIAAEMPPAAFKARQYVQQYEPLLKEMGGGVYNRFIDVVERKAATEALRDSPLGRLAGVTPEGAMQKLLREPDPVGTAKALFRQVIGTPGGKDALRGLKRAYADDLMRRVTDATDQIISPDKLAAALNLRPELTETVLGKRAVKTLRDIEAALRRTKEASAAKIIPVEKNQSFIDLIVHAAGAGAGGYFGSLEGGIAGLAASAGVTRLRDIVHTNAQTALREMLLDPAVAEAAMRRASERNLTAVPRHARKLFEEILRATPGMAVQATRPATQPATDAIVIPRVEEPAEPSAIPVPATERRSDAATNSRTAQANRRFLITPKPNGQFLVEIAQA